MPCKLTKAVPNTSASSLILRLVKTQMTPIAASLMKRVQTSFCTWVSDQSGFIDTLTVVLMNFIEQKLGGQDVFLPYIYDYVNTFTGKSITTEQWKDHLFSFYQKHNPSKIEVLNTIKFDVRTRISSYLSDGCSIRSRNGFTEKA